MSRLVFGLQPVRELLRARPRSVRGVLLSDEATPKLEGLARLAEHAGAPLRRVPKVELERRTKGGRHQGVLAEADDLPILDARGLVTCAEGLDPSAAVVVLDGVVDPQNFGAVIRSAVALGAPVVAWAEHASAPLTPATFRASAGAIEHATLARVRSLPSLLGELRAIGFDVVLLDPAGELELDEVDLTGRTALVIGAEEKGAKPAVRKAATVRARLPMRGHVESLNASVAAAVALYEVYRQKKNQLI